MLIIGGEDDKLVSVAELYATASFLGKTLISQEDWDLLVLGLQPYQVRVIPDAAHNFLLDEVRSEICMNMIIAHLTKIQNILEKIE